MNKTFWKQVGEGKTPLTAQDAPGVLKDLLLTLAAALWAGLAGSIFFVLLIIFANGNVQAAEDGAGNGILALYALDGRRIDDAPLLHTDVRIEINGLLARVRVDQHFTNPGSDWLEGIYQFPLPENSAVDQLHMQIGEQRLEGEIQERNKARGGYEKAKSMGQRAALLSQQRPNIFTTRVANIGPGETILVAFEYQQTVRYAQGRFRLRFPLVIGPRYIPGVALSGNETLQLVGTGWALDTDQVPDASQITPPVADPLEGSLNPVNLSVRLAPGMELSEIHSPYHELVRVLDDQGVYQLGLKSKTVPADRDFELRWTPKTGQGPKAAIFSEEWQGHEYALLMVVPPELETQGVSPSREVIFVVDTSGSMHGASIKQAKVALQLALNRLNPRDRFNLIQFNNHTHSLFEGAVPAIRQNLDQALEYVNSLQAEGGTEMAPALQRALQDGYETSRLRQVIFLTDGSVGNERTLFSLIRQKLGDSRLFTIAIGSAPNSYFMQRAAEFGRGSFTYIGDLAEVESGMRQLFQKLEQPALLDLHLSWTDNRQIEGYPAKIPDLYQGEPLLVVLKGDDLSGHLHLEGQLGGTIWRQSLALQSTGEDSGIHTLWARAKIKALLADLNQGGDENRLRDEVVELALGHQLVSRYTSLVVFDRTAARHTDEPLKQSSVPINLPHGWSSTKVFGQLPQTATASQLHLLLGICLLLLGLLVGFRSRVTVT